VGSDRSSGANQLFLLLFVAAGAGHLGGRVVAIVLATPFSFAASTLWAFAESERPTEPQPQPVTAWASDR
jgi:putative flippase GtrA